jgi:hypothetical protein
MPVITSMKGGRKLMRRCDVRVAIQHMANLVRIFLVDTRQSQTRESFRGSDIEVRSRALGRGAD